jgi:LysM repeat protein
MSNSKKNSAQKVISSYKKRQQTGPYFVAGFALLIIIIGIVLLVVWLTGSNRPSLSILTSATPTLTDTPTRTPLPPTSTITVTSTSTDTPTVTLTDTPSGPFEYTVQEGDTCYDIAVAHDIDVGVLIALNPAYGVTCIISPGDVLLIPLANQELPTDTPIATGLPKGTEIQYTVKSGDTVRGLAIRFNSTIDSIVTTNKLADSNSIEVGQVLTIKVNLVTPVPTGTETKTPGPETVVALSRTPTRTATGTSTVTPSPTATKTPTP